MKKKELPRLTPPEFEIMNAVWQAGELTITEIMNAINARRQKKLKRTTIQVQVTRLEEKGWLVHRDDEKGYLFKGTVQRQEAATAIVRDIGERVFGGSCFELVKSFFNGSAVSPEEIKKLRELLDKHEE